MHAISLRLAFETAYPNLFYTTFYIAIQFLKTAPFMPFRFVETHGRASDVK